MPVISGFTRRGVVRSAVAAGLAAVMTGGALVASSLVPSAFADHVDYGDPYRYGGNVTCESLGLVPMPAPAGGKVDPPAELDDNDYVTVTFSGYEGGKPTHIDVAAKDGFDITAVLVKGGRGGGGIAYFHGPFTGLYAAEHEKHEGKYQVISHYTICGEVVEQEEPEKPKHREPSVKVGAWGKCPDGEPVIRYWVKPKNFKKAPTTVTITFHGADGEDVTLAQQPLMGQIDWPADVDGELALEFTVKGKSKGKKYVEVSTITTVTYPEDCDSPEEPPAEPTIDLLIHEPICDGDVPYLGYAVVVTGGDDDISLTMTWINPDGDDVVYGDLPLEGFVRWPGAVVDEDGNPVDWPGWIQQADGTWVQGDDGFAWVRPSVDVLFSVNPDELITVEYPASSPDCDANPPRNEEPPTTEPPGKEPPAEEPPATEPPATAPPTSEPPVAAPPGGNLPDTGSSSGMLALLGAMLLALGGMAAVFGRRLVRSSASRN